MKNPSVVLTRTESDPHGLAYRHSHINWIDFPLIKFDYQELSAEIIQKIHDQYDWLVFTSQNGVKSFFEQVPSVAGKKIACVGPKTAGLVEKYGYEVNFVPSTYTSITLATEIPSSSEESLCYVGGNLSSDKTINALREKAKHFLQIESYHTVSKMHSRETWLDILETKPIIISFCSPSAVTSYTKQLEQFKLPSPNTTLMSAIGSTTAAAIRDDLGMTAIVGEKHTFASMIDKIVETIADDTQTKTA